MVKNIPHRQVLHTIDESEQICEKCGVLWGKIEEKFVCTEVQFIPVKREITDYYRGNYECRF